MCSFLLPPAPLLPAAAVCAATLLLSASNADFTVILHRLGDGVRVMERGTSGQREVASAGVIERERLLGLKCVLWSQFAERTFATPRKYIAEHTIGGGFKPSQCVFVRK